MDLATQIKIADRLGVKLNVNEKLDAAIAKATTDVGARIRFAEMLGIKLDDVAQDVSEAIRGALDAPAAAASAPAPVPRAPAQTRRRSGKSARSKGVRGLDAQVLKALQDGPKTATQLLATLGGTKGGLHGVCDRLVTAGQVTKDATKKPYVFTIVAQVSAPATPPSGV